MKKFHWVVFAVLFLSLTGCQKLSSVLGKKDLGPKEVADKFWSATKTGEVEKIRPFVTKSSYGSDMLKENSKPTEGEYTLGEVMMTGDNRAKIPTTLKGDGMNIDVETILVKEEGQWKIDVDATMMTMFGGKMDEMMKELGKTMEEGMKSVGEGAPGTDQGMEPPAPEEMGGEVMEEEGVTD